MVNWIGVASRSLLAVSLEGSGLGVLVHGLIHYLLWATLGTGRQGARPIELA